jgi:hypothetical protein
MHAAKVTTSSKSVMAFLLSPAVAHAQALALWAYASALETARFPRRMLVTSLYILNAASGDLLAFLTHQPTNKMQARSLTLRDGRACAHVAGAAANRSAGAVGEKLVLGAVGPCGRQGMEARVRVGGARYPPATPPRRAQLERQRQALVSAQQRLITQQRMVDVSP